MQSPMSGLPSLLSEHELRWFDQAIASFVDGNFNHHFFQVCYGAQTVGANASHGISHMRRRYSAHSRSQSPRSFWPATGIESSGLVQHREVEVCDSANPDWLRIRDEYSAQIQKIGSTQSSQSLPQVRRIVGSGNENVFSPVQREPVHIACRFAQWILKQVKEQILNEPFVPAVSS